MRIVGDPKNQLTAREPTMPGSSGKTKRVAALGVWHRQLSASTCPTPWLVYCCKVELA